MQHDGAYTVTRGWVSHEIDPDLNPCSSSSWLWDLGKIITLNFSLLVISYSENDDSIYSIHSCDKTINNTCKVPSLVPEIP